MEKVMWKEYPRPQMKRENWLSLNGTWKLNGDPVQVPFPPQSKLSGYQKEVPDIFVYEKTFALSGELQGDRILLHFGAVDQIAQVWLNGTYLGCHEGGYLGFSYDVTEWILREGANTLKVKVTDSLSLDFPYGKQRKKRGGMWYTPVSGIWKNVWLESVPEKYVTDLRLTPDLQGISIELFGDIDGFDVEIPLGNGKILKKEFLGKTGRVEIEDPHWWTPKTPYLYEMTIRTKMDQIDTYFALRTIEIADRGGVQRVLLNGSPIFLHGVLDQGYFPEGIYLPAEEKEYEQDILRMKELGFCLLRKHLKVEPEYFYYACDKLGMLVMQDMVNSGPYHFLRDTALPTIGYKKRGDQTGFCGKRKEFFTAHVENTIHQLYNHPSIVAYTIFNEGWGQFESDAIYERVKKWDPTRLVDSTSGWYAQKKSDFDSEHIYFKVALLEPGKRPLLLSECGGYTLLVEGHREQVKRSYGYGTCKNSRELTEKILELYQKMVLPAIRKGLCGCIYTQLSDVEDEINGLYTYDRNVCKVDKEKMTETAKALHEELERGEKTEKC